MIVSEASMRLAIRNISKHGDTDVLPYSLESYWFHDKEDDIVGILCEITKNFDRWIADYPPEHVRTLSGVGYVGLRAVSQIDAVWNAYLLSLLIEIGSDLEQARLGREKNTLFSYRFKPDPAAAMLFDSTLNWGAFQLSALSQAEGSEYVVSADISDFYARIYHHRLENALQQATQKAGVVQHIMVLLLKFSSHASYGLPVGGNAARILAEQLLNRTDRLLALRRIRFVRFVDDYYMFFSTLEDARRGIVLLSDTLLRNEGLTLARAKTRMMTKAEFLRHSPAALAEVGESGSEAEARQLLKIRLSYDRYSPTAEGDYASLASELERFDILGMLTREFEKSRADESVVRQLIKALKFVKAEVRPQAVSSIVRNLDKLYPVFPTIAIMLRGILPDLQEDSKRELFEALRALINRESHIILVPANLSYVVRLLAHDPSDEAEPVLVAMYQRPDVDMCVKRDVILAMCKRRATHWLSETLKRFSVLTPWEKRALIHASYLLGDEGQHWRKATKPQFSAVDKKYTDWVGEKCNGRQWEIPL